MSLSLQNLLSARLWMALLSAVMFATAPAHAQTGSGTGVSATATGSASAMGDGEILAIAQALNEVEVTTSETAAKQASVAAVKDFAQRMLDEHGKALQSLQQLAQSAQLQAKPNEVATTLQDTAKGVQERIAKQEQGTFANKYIEMQISLHQSALNLLDYTLIPRTQSDPLRQHLIEMRMKVDQHLQRAWEIYRGL